jgi:RNA polymerase sigma-70 factor (ECF subfamily)
VLGAALRILGDDWHLAEDVSQEAFCDGYLSLRSLRDPDRVGAWLTGIARRKALHTLSRRVVFEDIEDYAEMLSGASVSPEFAVIEGELRSAVNNAIASLGDKTREAAVLHFGDGLPAVEIARLLNVPQNTIRQRLYDARRKLKGELQAMVDIPKDDGFVKAVMEKIKKLKTYYHDHDYSKDGLPELLGEAETLALALPENREKQFALSEILYLRRYYGETLTDEQLDLALETAEKGRNHEVLLKLYVIKWSGVRRKNGGYETDYLNNTIIAKMKALKYDYGIGNMTLWRGLMNLRAGGDIDSSERDYREALRLITAARPEDVYRAVAIAAIRVVELTGKYCDNAYDRPAHFATVVGERIRQAGGVLHFEEQPGWGGRGSYSDRLAFAAITYYASRFDKKKPNGIFYDLSMRDGETRTDDDGNTLTLVSRDEEVRVPAGFFGKCLHVAGKIADTLNAYEFDAWYSPNVGLVKFAARDAEHDEVYELDEYDIKGGSPDAYFPLATGNRWNYVKQDLPDYIYQRNERIIEWTDGETANCSGVQIYSLKKGFEESSEIDSELCLRMCETVSYKQTPEDAADLLRRAVVLNTNRTDVDVALRGIEYLKLMRGYQEKAYRLCPSSLRASRLSVSGGTVTYKESELYTFGPSRFGTRFEEKGILGVKPLRFLNKLTGCVWNDKWAAGYTEEAQFGDDGVTRLEVTDGGTVTVPAGTFENCLKLTLTLERDTDDELYYFDGSKYMYYGVKECWFAPGVGLVRYDCAWGDKLSARCELISYNIPMGGGAYFPVGIGNRWEYDEAGLTAEGYRAKKRMEITSGVLGKFVLCESQEFVYLGTEEEYDAFKARLAEQGDGAMSTKERMRR